MSKIIRVEVFQVDLKPHVQRVDAILRCGTCAG